MPATLIFFTAGYPYGKGETFIENEIGFLAAAFEQVFIVTTDIHSTKPRPVPSNIKVIRHTAQVSLAYKIKALASFFTPSIRQEIGFVKKRLKLKLSKPVLSAMLGGYAQALYTAKLVDDIIRANGLSPASVVLYSYWMSNTATGIAQYKKNNPEVKTVCRAHGWDVYFERHSPPYLPLRQFALNGLNYCCCISANGKKYLDDLLPYNNTNIMVSRLGTFNKASMRSNGNINKLVIISCSNIIPLKRVHLIIEALAQINDVDIDWTHFGSGPLEDAIKATATEKLDKLPHIKYRFAGQVSNAQLLAYYTSNNIDLFINLSETEGLPVSFMEAGSVGIPVIATNVGGVSEIIMDAENGFLLDANALPVTIAQKIKAYFLLPESTKENMRDNAFKLWQKNYNAEENYRSFIDLLKA